MTIRFFLYSSKRYIIQGDNSTMDLISIAVKVIVSKFLRKYNNTKSENSTEEKKKYNII